MIQVCKLIKTALLGQEYDPAWYTYLVEFFDDVEEVRVIGGKSGLTTVVNSCRKGRLNIYLDDNDRVADVTLETYDSVPRNKHLELKHRLKNTKL
jgi:hypothetical protein